MRLVSAVSAGAGSSSASGRSSQHPRQRAPVLGALRADEPRRHARPRGASRAGRRVQIASKRRSRSRALPGSVTPGCSQASRQAAKPGASTTTAHSLPSASSRAIGTSVGAWARRGGRREVGEDVGLVGVLRPGAGSGARRRGRTLALEGGEEHGRGGVGERLVLDRPAQRDERALAQHLRPRADVRRRDGRVDRRAVGRPRPPRARARSRRGSTARGGGRPARGAAPRRPRSGSGGSPRACAPARGSRSAAPTCGSSRRRCRSAPRRP